MKASGPNFCAALLCAFFLTIPMKASDEALREWAKIFPEKGTCITGGEPCKDLCYVFFFKKDGAKVFCRVRCHLAPAENAHEELFFLSDGTGIGEAEIEVIVKSQAPDVRLSSTLSKKEVGEFFSKIVSFEVFSLGKAQNLEPGPVTLDGYSVLLLRQFNGQRVVIERTAGASIPVDSFVAEMWKVIAAKITTETKPNGQSSARNPDNR